MLSRVTSSAEHREKSTERVFNWLSAAHLRKALLYVGSEAASDRGQMGCTALMCPYWKAGFSGGSPPQPDRYCFQTPHWKTKVKECSGTPNYDLGRLYLLLHLVENAWLQCALRQDIITISLPTQIEHKKGYRAMKTSESPKWCDLMSKASAVLNIRDLQAIGRIDCQAGDLLRWLPTHPHQLDHQFHLVARRLLQWGAPHPASNTQQDTTAGCSLHWNKLSSMGKLHSGSSFLLLLLLLLL